MTVTKITDRRDTGSKLPSQAVSDNGVELLIAQRRDSIQRADLAVGDKMNMSVDKAWKHSCRLVIGEIPSFVKFDAASFYGHDLSMIEKYRRWSLGELFSREEPRDADSDHQLVILLESEFGQATLSDRSTIRARNRGLATQTEHRGQTGRSCRGYAG